MQTRMLICALNPCLRATALNTSCSGTTTPSQGNAVLLCTVAAEEIETASAPNRIVRVNAFWEGEVKRQSELKPQVPI